MYKKLFSVIVSLLFFSIVSMAQQLDWVHQYKGQYDEYVAKIKTDINGNQIRVGAFMSTVDFDPGLGNSMLSSYSALRADGFIQKFDNSGDLLWVKQIKSVLPSLFTNYGTRIYDVDFDAFGNLYMMGCSDGTVDFDPDTGVFNLVNDVNWNSQLDANFILKLDSLGGFVWAKKIGYYTSADVGSVHSFGVDNQGNVYVTGEIKGSNVDLDPGSGVSSMSAGFSNNRDGFVFKLDSSGNFVWKKQMKSSWGVYSYLDSYSITVDDFGNTYTTGGFSGDYYFGPGGGNQNLSSPSGIYKSVFILKLDTYGNSVWVKQIDAGNPGTTVAIDILGDIIVAGGFIGTVDFNPGVGVDYLFATTPNSTFILKLDSAGNYIYAKRTGGVAYVNDKPILLEVDKGNNVYIAAEFSGTDDFDPSLGIYNLTTTSSFSNYIQKLDNNGNFVWVKPIHERAYISSLTTDSLYNVFFSGFFALPFDIDPNTSTHYVYNTSINSNYYDAFVAKFNQDSCAYNISLIIDSAQNIACTVNSGYVSAFAMGGSSPYSYSWNTVPVTNDSIAVIDTTGIYEVTVNDANGCVKSSAVIINGPTDQNNFDLNTNLIATTFRPGFSANLWLDAFNNGCLPSSGQVKLILSYLVNYDSASIAPDIVQGDTLIWNFSNLIYDSIHFLPQIFLTTDTSATIGNQACFDVIINPIMGDFDSTNNIKNFCFDIINGYDPNDKKVYPKGECNEKYVLKNQKLTYTVRFQNTGNAEAINVYVVDSLDANLDINSVRVTSKSHDKLITEVVEGNILKFRFDNILLVDSATNEPESHGFVVFEVQPIPSLPNGTEIKNSVGIYFDYNPVVVTNSTISTLVDTLNFSTYGFITDSVCNRYVAPSGKIYTTSGNYIDIVPNSVGCDSIVYLNITVKDVTYATFWESECYSYTSPSGNYIWQQDGVYVDTIINISGCDSVITINLEINHTDTFLTVNQCEDFISPSGNYFWTESGTYNDTILNSLGCDSIIVIDLIINNIPKYKVINKAVTPNRLPFDRFGHSVSISGNYLVIGAIYAENGLSNAGAAYVFENNGDNNWVYKQKIVAPVRGSFDNFGYSVSISGNYIVIGASGEDEDENEGNTMSSSGSAYIFENDGTGSWSFKQKIVAPVRGSSDNFGYSVAINGDNLIVGAKSESEDEGEGNTIGGSGSAYIFENDGTGSWNFKQKIVAPVRGSADNFGYSVSISGNYLVIGASGEDEDENEGNTMSSSGSAYIFENDGTGNWVFNKKIVAPDRNYLDQFGCSVSLDNGRVVVGAFWQSYDANGGNVLTNAGSAYIFENDGTGSWSFKQKIVAPIRGSNDNFGYSVAISGNKLIVGSKDEDEDENEGNTLSKSGSAYVFEKSNMGSWSFKQKIVAPVRGQEDNFGYSVAINGNTLIVGAREEDEDENEENTMSSSGSAYIFDYNYNSTINATTCNNYTLNSQTYTTSGTYQQLLTNQMGCDSVVTLNLTLNAAGLLITQNGSALFANDSTATYQWIDCSTGNSISGATNQTYIVTTNGDYAVVLSKNGCIDTSACISIMSVGTYDVVNDFGIEIYPNPTGSLLNVVFKQNELYQLKITAIDGKIIDAKTINGNTIFDVSKYSSGMYFISASNKEGKVFQSKFVKE